MVSPSNEPIRVNVMQDSLLGETRVNIALPNGDDVTQVRAHNFITAFFLSLFGKIEKIEGRDEKTKQMKTFYINRNSLINKSPDKNQLDTTESGNKLVRDILAQVSARRRLDNNVNFVMQNRELFPEVIAMMSKLKDSAQSDQEKRKFDGMISALSNFDEKDVENSTQSIVDSGAIDLIKQVRERKNAFKFLMDCNSNDAENLFKAALEYVNQLKAPDPLDKKYDNGYDNPAYAADLFVHNRKIGFVRDGVLTKFVNQVRNGYVDEEFVHPLVNDDNFMSFLIEKRFIQKK